MRRRGVVVLIGFTWALSGGCEAARPDDARRGGDPEPGRDGGFLVAPPRDGGALDAGDGAPPGPPEVEVGTGAARFEPLEEGDHVTLFRGAQGGYHVWGSVRVARIVPDDVALIYTVRLDESGEEIARRAWRERLVPLEDGRFEWVGLWAQLSVPTTEVVDRDVLLRIDVDDGRGHTGAGEVRVRVDPR